MPDNTQLVTNWSNQLKRETNTFANTKGLVDFNDAVKDTFTQGINRLHQKIDEDAQSLQHMKIANHKELQLELLDKKFKTQHQEQSVIFDQAIQETVERFNTSIDTEKQKYFTDHEGDIAFDSRGTQSKDEAAAAYLKQQLETQKKYFLDTLRDEFERKIIAFIEQKHNILRELEYLDLAYKSQRNAHEVQITPDREKYVEGLRRTLKQPTVFRSSDDGFNLAKHLIFGPYATMITRKVDENGRATYHFNPRDREARIKIYEAALADKDCDTMTLNLGVHDQQTNVNPDNNSELRDAAMHLTVLCKTGGLIYPSSALRQSLFSADRYAVSGDYDAEKISKYMKDHKSLPPGFKFPDNRIIPTVKIENFNLDEHEQKFLKNVIEISDAIRKTRVELLKAHIDGTAPLTDKQMDNIGLNSQDFATVNVTSMKVNTDAEREMKISAFAPEAQHNKLNFRIILQEDRVTHARYYWLAGYDDSTKQVKEIKLTATVNPTDPTSTAKNDLYAILNTHWDNLNPKTTEIAKLAVDLLHSKALLKGEHLSTTEEVFDTSSTPGLNR